MGFRDKQDPATDHDPREVGVSTEPGASYLDQQQKAELEGKETDVTMGVPVETGKAVDPPKDETPRNDVQFDRDALEILEPSQVDREPKQVENVEVLFVPFKDFEARINQTVYHFRQDVQTLISRDLANDLVNAKRGYTKD